MFWKYLSLLRLLVLSQTGRKASAGIFQGEMVECEVILHTVQIGNVLIMQIITGQM